jgi:4'-phosphopantetheinyl transferase
MKKWIYFKILMSIVDIVYFNAEVISENDFSIYLEQLAAKQREQVLAYKNFSDRRLSLFGKLIVKNYFVRKSVTIQEFFLRENGKPYIENGFFNISHTRTIAAAAFCDGEIGLDIECVHRKSNIDAIAQRFCREESDYIANSADRQRDFFYIWTRKESLLKAKGTGISEKLSRHNCIHDTINDTANNTLWHLESFSLNNDYLGAVCTQTAVDAPLKAPLKASLRISELHADDFSVR